MILSLMAIRLKKEDKELKKRFAIGYITYMDKTGRFLPRSLLPSRSMYMESPARNDDTKSSIVRKEKDENR